MSFSRHRSIRYERVSFEQKNKRQRLLVAKSSDIESFEQIYFKVIDQTGTQNMQT